MSLLEVRNLGVDFLSDGHSIRAVSDVSFDINRGETLALVGESGSGKSTIGRMILGLHDISSGQIWYKGSDISTAADRSIRRDDCLSMQCIFQDPFSSLNPRMTAGENITHAVRVHKLAQKNECEQLAKDLLNLVGLQQSDSRKLPHAFSGGERQRIGIARALALRPDFIFCDEPTSSLDVSVQASFFESTERFAAGFFPHLVVRQSRSGGYTANVRPSYCHEGRRSS